MARVKGIALKKQFGQHFLRSRSVVDEMLNQVDLTKDTKVFEIGCGDGFLTRAILECPVERLWAFEIDHEWATYVRETIKDERFTLFETNILDFDWRRFAPYAPWVLLSNLPYQISFPILHLVVNHRDILQEGVVMVQEEVAQKIVKTSGRGYGFVSLYFQHYFVWQMLSKVPPGAFVPPPKVYSRLLYFKPRPTLDPIVDIDSFWQFIKICFRAPRRMLRNNLMQAHYDISRIPDEVLKKRAQQLTKAELITLWNLVRPVAEDLGL